MKMRDTKAFPDQTGKRRDTWSVRLPAPIALVLIAAGLMYMGGSTYWIVAKDNEIEKFRRNEIMLQNEIKERDQMLQQNRQKLEQLGRRVEILDAIKQLSSADVSESDQVKIAKLVDEQSEKFGQDPFFLLALMAAESSLRPWARSDQGASGLMQIMPSTGRALARQVAEDPSLIGLEGGDAIASLSHRDIEGNVKLGTLYFTQLVVRYESIEEAVYAYNLGPPLYEKRRREGGRMPVRYYTKIMNTYENLLEWRDRKANASMPVIYAKMEPEAILAQASGRSPSVN